MRSPGLPRGEPDRTVPRWLVLLGAVAVSAMLWFGLGRIVLAVLAAPS